MHPVKNGGITVLCSIHSRDRKWVDLEVAEFLKNQAVTRVFPVLVGDTGGLPEVDLFPKSLRAALRASEGEIGALSLLAIDLRSTSDGPTLGLLKLIAGTIGITLRELVDRQKARSRRTRVTWSIAAFAALLLAVQIWGEVLSTMGRSQLVSLVAQLSTDVSDNYDYDDYRNQSYGDLPWISGCGFGSGACGYLDEEHGPTSIYRTAYLPDNRGFFGQGEFFMHPEVTGRYHTSYIESVNSAIRLSQAKVVASFADDRESIEKSKYFWETYGRSRGIPYEEEANFSLVCNHLIVCEIETEQGETFTLFAFSVPPREGYFRKYWLQ